MSGRLTGQWESVIPKIQVIAKSITPLMLDAVKAEGQRYIEEVIAHVRNQDLPLTPLAPSTVRRKSAHNTEWWIETEKFINKLSVHWQYKGVKKASVLAGALERVRYNGRYSMFQLASILEYGYGRIPARPLFTMTLKSFKPTDLSDVGAKIKVIWDGK